MDMLIIRGGRPLQGTVAVSGAKNAALPIMAAALAVGGTCRLRNVPDLADVGTQINLLESLGARCERDADGGLVVQPAQQSGCVAAYDLVRTMRAGVCVLGPLLARYGRARVSLPGGCNIGHRPIDLHLKGLRALGATIRIEQGYVVAEADRLVGTDIYLGGPFGSTVTGTCNVLSAAALADGATTIEAAACEPEVVDLGRFLIAAGAQITGLGTPTIHVEGVARLHGCEHAVCADRIEAATLLIAGAISRGQVAVTGTDPTHLTAVLELLKEMGVGIRCEGGTIHVDGTAPLRPAECVALPFPAIPTDVQAQLTALLTLANGISLVTDKVFPDRFMHISELARMGARIRREGASAIVSGPTQLSGASVMASDLRASAALVLAALAAEGPSVVRRVYHLDRGYERLDEKLRSLGADVVRVADEPANVPAELRELAEPPAISAIRPPHFASGPTRTVTPQR